MADDGVSVLYDGEADYLEVIWNVAEGVFTATEDDRVMLKVDESGKVLGFNILGLRNVRGEEPLLLQVGKYAGLSVPTA